MNKSEQIQTDQAIVESFLETHEAVYFDMLYERYADKVYAKCIGMLKEETLAEDATQEVFIKILTSISRFEQKSSFSTWVYAITYNLCIDSIRRRKKKTTVEFEDYHQEELNEAESIEEVSDKELLEIRIDRLGEVLHRAMDEDRAILLMKYADNMSIRDISEVIGKSESAVKMNIMRAKQRAKKIYNSLYDE